MSTQISDEELMAFADGACEPAQARMIESAIQKNPALAARVDMFRSTSAMVKQAFPSIANAAKDKDLAAMIRTMGQRQNVETETDNVVQFRPKAKPQSQTRPMVWQQAAAAAVVLGLGLAGGYLLSSPAPTLPGEAGNGLLAFAPEIQTILNATPSGGVVDVLGGKLNVIASFKDPHGSFCREFEHARNAEPKSVAIACRKADGWQTMMLATVVPADDGFTPAGGAQAIESYLQSSGMTQALTPEEEKALLKP